MTRCSAANSSMRAVTSIDAAVFSGVGACRIAQRLIQFNMLTSVITDEPASGNRNRPCLPKRATALTAIHRLACTDCDSPASAMTGRRVHARCIYPRKTCRFTRWGLAIFYTETTVAPASRNDGCARDGFGAG
ncbi:conserved hypothetical protein [Burkholderia cenocepacia]|nr:conserved hypothetical protein [Burkholderia cenocepacia]